MKNLILTFFILFFVLQSHAARRYLELELEEVEGATGYHVQVTKILSNGEKKKPFIFKLKNNQWAATLNPGRYELAIRSVDDRGVPGEWSAAEIIEVKLPAPSELEPRNETSLQSKEKVKDKIQFKWQAVDSAEKYVIKIYDDSGKVVKEDSTKDTYYKIELDVAKKYNWEVAAIFDSNLVGDFSEKNAVAVVGPKIQEPVQKRIEDINTNNIEWKPSEFAQKYEVILERKDKNKEWKFYDKKVVNDPQIKFTTPLASGEYRYRVVAQSHLRLDSDPLYQEFKTNYFPNRSLAAIEQIKSEQSYETKSRFFAVASYFISMVNYLSNNYDTNTVVAYNALGGTGRLGAGWWFKEDGIWGVMTNVDMSGFTVANQTQTYLAAQMGVAMRLRLGALGQLRTFLGAHYRELPLTIAFSSNGTPQFNQTKLNSLGPAVSVSLARGLTRKLGLQVNGAISQSMSNMGTPNGLAQEPRMSYQYGLLGSLKLSESIVGFMGYAYRADVGSYRSTSSQNSMNELSITGHYLNLMLEYGF